MKVSFSSDPNTVFPPICGVTIAQSRYIDAIQNAVRFSLAHLTVQSEGACLVEGSPAPQVIWEELSEKTLKQFAVCFFAPYIRNGAITLPELFEVWFERILKVEIGRLAIIENLENHHGITVEGESRPNLPIKTRDLLDEVAGVTKCS